MPIHRTLPRYVTRSLSLHHPLPARVDVSSNDHVSHLECAVLHILTVALARVEELDDDDLPKIVLTDLQPNDRTIGFCFTMKHARRGAGVVVLVP